MKWIIILFSTKVAFGILNLYFHNTEYISNDSHTYFEGSMKLLADFPNRPAFYINDWLFNWGEIHKHLNFLNKNNAAYWTDVGRLFHTRFMLVSTILSFGNEYVNVLFYNFFFFMGLLGLYKTCSYFKPDQRRLFLWILFAIPSVTFWCSGLYKDGFVLSLIGAVSWSAIKVYHSRHWKNILLLIGSLLLLLALRYFYFLIFLPFFLLAIFTRNQKKPVLYFIALSMLGVLVFFFSPLISPKLNFMQLVVNRQNEFFDLRGYSDMKTPRLQDRPIAFVQNLPSALEHVFIEPIPNRGGKIKYEFTALDSLIVLFILVLALLKLKRRNFKNSYFLLLLFYATFCLLFIGYTVPNLGAIVRYESPFICLLLLSLFGLGDFTIRKLSFK